MDTRVYYSISDLEELIRKHWELFSEKNDFPQYIQVKFVRYMNVCEKCSCSESPEKTQEPGPLSETKLPVETSLNDQKLEPSGTQEVLLPECGREDSKHMDVRNCELVRARSDLQQEVGGRGFRQGASGPWQHILQWRRRYSRRPGFRRYQSQRSRFRRRY